MIRLIAAALVLMAPAGAVPVHDAWREDARPDRAAPARSTPVQDIVVQRGRVRPEAAAMRLQGRTDIAGLDGQAATILLHDGARTTTTTATLPAFAVDLPAGATGDMVSIEVRVPGARYPAILGSRGLLARVAAGRKAIDDGDFDRLRIDVFATALHARATAVAGRLPSTDGQYERALASANDILDTAATLDALARAEAPLPGGFDDGYALVSDDHAFRTFRALQRHLYTRERSAALVEAHAAAPFPRAALDGRWAALGAVAPTALQFFPTRTWLLSGSGGRFEVLGWSGVDARHAGAGVTQSDAGTLAIDYDRTRRSQGMTWVSHPSAPPEYVLYRDESPGRQLRRIFDGEAMDLWTVVDTHDRSYPGRPDLGAERYTSTFVAHVVPIGVDLPPLAARHVVGRRTLPVFCAKVDAGGDPRAGECDYAEVAFSADGTGQAFDIGAKVDARMHPVAAATPSIPFTWELLRDGTLTVRFRDAEIRYWRIGARHADGESLAYVARVRVARGEQSIAGQTLMFDAARPPVVDADAVAGRWGLATFDQQRWLDWRSIGDPLTRFLRTADGIVQQVEIPHEDVPPRPPVLSFWSTPSFPLDGVPVARLYDSRATTPSLVPYPDCDAALADGATSCRMERVRVFRPVRQVGDRLYGIEDLYVNQAGYGAAPVVERHSRPNAYTRDELPSTP